MSGYDVDKVMQTSNFRFHYQPGGPAPSNKMYYAGDDGEYITIESAENPRVGGIEPHNVHHPFAMKEFEAVARNRSAPGLPKATIQFLSTMGFIPQHLWMTRRLLTTFYGVGGDTSDLSNFATGWRNGYIKIYSLGEGETSTEKAGSWDSSDLLTDEIPYTFQRIYAAGTVAIDEKAALQVYSEAISGVYGPRKDGLTDVYVVTNNTVASAGQAPAVYYRTSKTGSFTELAITGSVSTDVPKKILVVGQYLVVVFKSATTGGYFYTTINEKSGIHSSSWTKVTTGFVSGKAPNDAFSANARQFYVCGDGGYVYKISSVTTGAEAIDAGESTTNNLNKIRVNGSTILVAGNSDSLLISLNNGKTFTLDSTGSGANLMACFPVNSLIFWAATSAGAIYVSEDGAETWTQVTLSSAIATVQDILFVTPECGFICTASSDPVATIYATCNGGVDWLTGEPRISGLPTFDRANQLVAPTTRDASADVNHFIIAGLAGNGSDGIVLTGVPNSL